MEWYCRDRKNKYGDYNKSIKKYYNEDSNKWVTKLNKKTIEEKYIRYEFSCFDDREIEILSRSVIDSFDQYVKLNKKIAPEVMTSLSGIDDPSRLVDTIAAHMVLKMEEKQAILEINDVKQRIENIIGLIENELDILQVEKKIRGRVKNQMEKSQREYYLNEQMKAIQKELGDMDDVPNEIEDIEKKIAKSGMHKDVMQKIKGDINKLKMMSPMSAEASVLRN